MNRPCIITFWIITFRLIVSAINLYANQIPLESLIGNLPVEALTDLKDDGIAFRWDRAGIGFALAPDHPDVQRMRKNHAGLEPNILVEGIYLIPYPENSNGIDLNLYNTLRQVSKISTIKYFSDRRKAMVPLFNKVYRFDTKFPNKPLPDTRVDSIPAHDQFYLKMKETNLGPAEFKAQYIYNGESLGFILENITPLRFIFKVVDSNNMQIHLLVFPTEKEFFVYGYCIVRLSNPGLVDMVMDPWSGFYKRMYTLVVWVENTLHGTEKQPVMGKRLDF